MWPERDRSVEVSDKLNRILATLDPDDPRVKSIFDQLPKRNREKWVHAVIEAAKLHGVMGPGEYGREIADIAKLSGLAQTTVRRIPKSKYVLLSQSGTALRQIMREIAIGMSTTAAFSSHIATRTKPC